MPLSEHEQKILQEIERQFYEEDPKFARGVASGTIYSELRRNFRRGIAVFILGFLVLGGFFLRPALVVGVAAFLLMLSGAILMWHSVRRLGSEGVERPPDGPKDGAPFSKLFGNMEDRLRDMRRRRDS